MFPITHSADKPILDGVIARPHEISPRRPLFFVHVPKAAGNSIRHFLARCFPAGATRWLRHDMDSLVPNRLELGQHACYAGHEVYRYAESLPHPPVVITILREPVDRAVSTYYFNRGRGREVLRAEQGPWRMERMCDLSLGEFLLEEPATARQLFGNLQTAMFSHSVMPHLTGREATLGDLEVAKQNLARCAVVGLMERLPESLQLICHSLGWPMPDRVPWENKTQVKKNVVDHDPDTVRQLRELTALDAELYRFGVELFDKQLAAMQHELHRPRSSRDLPAAAVYAFDWPIPGYGWHLLEKSPHGAFCWSEGEAWLEFLIAGRGRLNVQILALAVLHPDQISALELSVNGFPVKGVWRQQPPGWTLNGSVDLPPAQQEAGRVRLQFRLPRVIRPCDLNSASSDTRNLGVAVHRVELRFAAALSRQRNRAA